MRAAEVLIYDNTMTKLLINKVANAASMGAAGVLIYNNTMTKLLIN